MTGRDYRWWRATSTLAVRARRDVLGLAWVGLVVVAFLSPALKNGLAFGPSALGGQLSYFTYVPGLVVHNNLNGDVITQAVAWNRLDWLAVHHGQLPLWNDYSAGGMPLLLNFESAAFSLPALVGYLFPLASSYLVVVAVKLLVAGTGTYVAARLVGVGPTGSALAATTFMLSGSLSGWLGWAVSAPLVWAGWLLVGALLCWRPRGPRSGGAVVLALATAFAVYGGFPETLVLLAIGMASVVLIGGVTSARAGRAASTGGRCRGRPPRRRGCRGGSPVRSLVAARPGSVTAVSPSRGERDRRPACPCSRAALGPGL